MVDEIRVRTVQRVGSENRWTIRGALVQSGESFKADTEQRDLMALCLGGAVTRWPIRVERDERGLIVSATVV